MEQTEPIAGPGNEALPPSEQVPLWDPEKAAMRKVRVIKAPYDQDPMKAQTVFEFGGFVYICYAKKTRGRSMIRCLGLADIGKESPEFNPEEIAAAAADMCEKIDEYMLEGMKEAEDNG